MANKDSIPLREVITDLAENIVLKMTENDLPFSENTLISLWEEEIRSAGLCSLIVDALLANEHDMIETQSAGAALYIMPAIGDQITEASQALTDYLLIILTRYFTMDEVLLEKKITIVRWMISQLELIRYALFGPVYMAYGEEANTVEISQN